MGIFTNFLEEKKKRNFGKVSFGKKNLSGLLGSSVDTSTNPLLDGLIGEAKQKDEIKSRLHDIGSRFQTARREFTIDQARKSVARKDEKKPLGSLGEQVKGIAKSFAPKDSVPSDTKKEAPQKFDITSVLTPEEISFMEENKPGFKDISDTTSQFVVGDFGTRAAQSSVGDPIDTIRGRKEGLISRGIDPERAYQIAAAQALPKEVRESTFEQIRLTADERSQLEGRLKTEAAGLTFDTALTSVEGIPVLLPFAGGIRTAYRGTKFVRRLLEVAGKDLIGIKNIETVTNTLRESGLSETIARSVAPDIAKATTEREVSQITTRAVAAHDRVVRVAKKQKRIEDSLEFSRTNEGAVRNDLVKILEKQGGLDTVTSRRLATTAAIKVAKGVSSKLEALTNILRKVEDDAVFNLGKNPVSDVKPNKVDEFAQPQRTPEENALIDARQTIEDTPRVLRPEEVAKVKSEISDLEELRSITVDNMTGHPGQFLNKFATGAANGQRVLPELKSGITSKGAKVTNRGKFNKEGDDLVTRAFDNSSATLDEGQQAVDEYNALKKELTSIDEQIRSKKLEVRDAAVINKVLDSPAARAAEKASYTRDSNIVDTEARRAAGDIVADWGKIDTHGESYLDGGIDPENLSRFASFRNNINEMWTRAYSYYADSSIALKNLVDQNNVRVTTKVNPWENYGGFKSIVSNEIEKGDKIFTQIDADVVATAKQQGVTPEEIQQTVTDYMVAKHAPERNAKLGPKAAGMSDELAAELVTQTEALPYFADIQRIRNSLSGLHKQTLEILLDSGVIDADTFKLLRTTYKNHVPLNRVMEEDDIVTALTTKGFDVKGSGLKKAKGSDRQISDMMENIKAARDSAIVRGHKNMADLNLVQFARDNKHLDVFSDFKPKVIGEAFDGKPILEQVNDPNVLAYMDNGKQKYLRINDNALAAAIKGTGTENIPGMLKGVAWFTRTYAGLLTRFNMEFWLPNKIRDVQEMAIYAHSMGDAKIVGSIAKKELKLEGVRAVVGHINNTGSEGALLYKQMLEDGGAIGGMGLSTREEITSTMKQLRGRNRSKVRAAQNKLVDILDNANRIFEDSTRYSVYKNALDRGLSRERAAFLARESTINFNRKGSGGTLVNSLWMFFNASVQGSTKLVRAIKRDPLRVGGSTFLAVGAATTAVNKYNDTIDPNWRDGVTEWDKLNSLPIVIPTGNGDTTYISLPVAWGIKPMKVIADAMYDAISGKEVNPMDTGGKLLAATVNAYNPVGGTDVMSAVTPTILDIPLEVARNQGWSGGKIFPDWDKNAPANIKYFNSLADSVSGRTFITLTDTLYRSTNGQIPLNPAIMDYVFNQLIGGAGRSVNKTVSTINQGVQGKVAPINEIPIISRFLKNRTAEEKAPSEVFKENSKIQELRSFDSFTLNKNAEETYQNLKALPASEAEKAFNKIINEQPDLARKINEVKKQDGLGITRLERSFIPLQVRNGDRARAVYRYMMTNFNNDADRAKLFDNWVKKKIITSQVAQQINFLKSTKANPKKQVSDIIKTEVFKKKKSGEDVSGDVSTTGGIDNSYLAAAGLGAGAIGSTRQLKRFKPVSHGRLGFATLIGAGFINLVGDAVRVGHRVVKGDATKVVVDVLEDGGVKVMDEATYDARRLRYARSDLSNSQITHNIARDPMAELIKPSDVQQGGARDSLGIDEAVGNFNEAMSFDKMASTAAFTRGRIIIPDAVKESGQESVKEFNSLVRLFRKQNKGKRKYTQEEGKKLLKGAIDPKAAIAVAAAGGAATVAANALNKKDAPTPTPQVTPADNVDSVLSPTEAPEVPGNNKVRVVPDQFKEPLQSAYSDNPELPKGLLEAIIMKESSMGTIDSQKNPDINGKAAWLVGMTQQARDEIKRVLGKDATDSTFNEAITSMADYLKTLITRDNLSNVDPIDLYFKYAGEAKDTPEARKIFTEIFKYYAGEA